MPLISSGHCRHCARNRRPTRHAGLAPSAFYRGFWIAATRHGVIPAHLKMENWVDASKIHLANYEPRNLGADDAAALEGFERRMKELIEYSKPRSQRLMTPVLIGSRKAVEPVALECALETSRVAADLLHTLGQLTTSEKRTGGGLHGRIRTGVVPRFERVPARVVIWHFVLHADRRRRAVRFSEPSSGTP